LASDWATEGATASSRRASVMEKAGAGADRHAAAARRRRRSVLVGVRRVHRDGRRDAGVLSSETLDLTTHHEVAKVRRTRSALIKSFVIFSNFASS
jgi:hypothetical protein